MKPITRQILAILPVILIKCSCGLAIGWVAPMLARLKNSPETAFTFEQCAWIASGHYITRAFSPFLALITVDRYGRNTNLIFASFLCFVIWIAIYCSKSAYVHYMIRFILGIGIGLCETATNIYIGENASSNLRGTYSGFCSASFYLGELVEYILAAYLSYEVLAATNGVLAIFVMASTWFLKEPAQYLLMKGKVTEAAKNYNYLHDLQKSTSKLEFDDIKQYVNELKERKFSWKVFQSREAYKSMRLVFITNFCALAGGFTAVNSFVTMVLEDSDAVFLTILFGAAQFLSVLASSLFMDRFNRRTLFLVSTALITIVHGATAGFFYIDTIYGIPNIKWWSFSLLTLFSCLVGMFLGPLPSTITGELLPQDVKAMGSCLAVVSGSIGGFLGAKIFLPIMNTFGIYVNFIIFMILNLFLFVYVYIDLPETKGKTLVEIQRELRGKNPRQGIV